MSSEPHPGAGAITNERDLSIWSHKPWWCQPWSILLTGVAVVTISWLLFGRWWLSVVIAIAVLFWWGLFLVFVPAAWRQEAQAAAAASSSGASLDTGGGR
mgnify:CR=1 FL=1